MRMMRGLTPVVIGLATLALVACGGKPKPTVVELTMSAAEDANFHDGSARPVQLRIYQLKSPTAFEEANYYQLAEDESAALGADMLGKEEYFLNPGAVQEVVREVNPDTRYLGLVAVFRNIDSATWRATVPVRANKTTELTATVGAASVTVE